MKQFLLSLCCALALSACQEKEDALRVGTISGPETELVKAAQTVALRNYQLKIKVVEFSDYNMPNRALSEGDLDANVFQHLPYLKEAQKAFHYAIAPIGKTFIFPMGIYSRKIKNLTELSDSAVVAIPNDPSNETRALLLLESAGVISLAKHDDFTATVRDITGNPKRLVFKELDAAQLPRSLDDVALAVINTNFAIPAGLNPAKDALFKEDANSPYANLIVVQKRQVRNEKILQLVKALHSSEVEAKAKALFGDGAIKAW